MTPGRLVRGVLTPPNAVSSEGGGLANPATAAALANQPTVTPNYAACPQPAAPTLAPRPATGTEMNAEMIRFLSAGGSLAALEDGLRKGWNLLDDKSIIGSSTDFIGGGSGQILLTYFAPDDGGTLLILGCADGRYYNLYQAVTGGTTPQVLAASDLNNDGRPDLLFTGAQCSGDKKKNCIYRTQLVTWKPDVGRFVSLLNEPLTSMEPPLLRDVDNDKVQEVVVRLTNSGTPETGPLRTGVNIYDWNGSTYVLSIVQLDPPRFLIQILQEADRNFARQDTKQAIVLYQLALNDKSLRGWFNDDATTLNSYALYRLLLAYAYTEDKQLLPAYNTIVQTYPDPVTAPVYIAMSSSFWNALQVTNNLHSACIEVQGIITVRPEALRLLNRYGSSGPAYSAQDLCPF
jgi:hypothetical protein